MRFTVLFLIVFLVALTSCSLLQDPVSPGGERRGFERRSTATTGEVNLPKINPDGYIVLSDEKFVHLEKGVAVAKGSFYLDREYSWGELNVVFDQYAEAYTHAVQFYIDGSRVYLDYYEATGSYMPREMDLDEKLSLSSLKEGIHDWELKHWCQGHWTRSGNLQPGRAPVIAGKVVIENLALVQK